MLRRRTTVATAIASTLTAALILSLTVALTAEAAVTGWLDRAFGTQGLATVDGAVSSAITTVDTSGRALVLAKSTTGSSYSITRLTAGGVVDSTFGTGGRTTLPALTEGYLALAAGPSGTVVAVGAASDAHLHVVRLSGTGALDGTFGSGGAVNVAVPAAAVSGPRAGDPVVAAVDGADGSVVLSWQHSGGTLDSPVVRLSSAGVIDSGFAGGAAVLSATRVVALVPSAGTVVLTRAGTASVSRLTAAGQLDASWGSGGTSALPSPVSRVGGVAAAPGGGFLVGGIDWASSDHSVGRITVTKLTSTGALSSAFGASGTGLGGWTCAAVPPSPLATATSIYLVGGCGYAPTLARFSSVGVVDTGFGGGGTFTLSEVGDLFSTRWNGAGLTPSGQVIVGLDGTLSSNAEVLGVTRLRTTTAVPPGGFVPLPPARILDTRSGVGAPAAAVAAHGTLTLTVAGRGGVPTGDAGAVVLNITVTGPTQPGYITAYPTGAARPTASNVNFVAHQTIPDLAIVKAGTGGAVSLYNGSTGTVHLVVDVSGYYRAGTASAAGTLAPLTPARILDTRNGTGAAKAPVAAQGSLTLAVAGHGGVPASGAGAVVLTVTAVAATKPGYITAYPAGTTRPTASNLNFVAGSVVPNLVTVAVGTGGAVTLFNGSAGTVHLLADVTGYYRSGASSAPGTFVPLTPTRVLDTRSDPDTTGHVLPIAAAGSRDIELEGSGVVPATDVAGVVLNVTVTAPTKPGFVTAFPTDQAVFSSSNLNFTAGQTVANQVDIGVGYGAVTVYNGSGGSVHVIADVGGWFHA